MSSRYAIDPLDVMVLAGQGKTAQEAADALDCSLPTIYTHAKEIGVTFHNPVRTPDDVRARVDQLRAAGLSQSQIAAQVGKSRSWVAMYLRGER